MNPQLTFRKLMGLAPFVAECLGDAIAIPEVPRRC